MRTLAIRLFGRLEVLHRGEPWRFSAPPRVTPLLAYLLLHAGEPIPRVTLANLLWPDDPDDVARTNLRRHLHEVVRALPPGKPPWIVATMESLCWPLRDDVWIDVHEFERGVSDPERSAEALELYRGDLLADFYDEWLLAEQERLRARYHELLYEAAARARGSREFAQALRYVDRILAQDEWREDAVRLGMSIKYESGDRTGALTDFTQFAARLKKEMRVDPMPETQALRGAILANAPLTPQQIDEERIGAAGTPFIGRAGELATLTAAWSRAARGGGGAFFVGGEAGIGKSRLVGELAARVAAEGGRVLSGGTSNGEAFPYEPIVEAFHRNVALLAEARIDRTALSRLAQLLPELAAALPDLPIGDDADPASARSLLFDAIARTIEQLARTRPLLFVLEDLHWANASTLDALEAIARRIGSTPILLVATYRPEETGPDHPLSKLLERLHADRRAGSLQLRAFSKSEVQELARETVRAAETRDVAAAVYELCDGNTLFAVQLLHGYAETGALPTQQSASGTLAGAVLARIESLDDRSRALAETGAIVGRSFTIEVAARVLGWNEDLALHAVGPLLERSIVRGSGGTAFAFTFTHALIADAIYASTPESRRAARHRRIAHVISELGELEPSALASVARHWRAAGDRQRAATAFEHAAVRATEVYAYDEALESCELVLALGDDDAASVRVLLLRESIHSMRASREDQRRTLDAIEKIARNRNDGALAWEILRRRTILARATADHATEEALLAELERLAVQAGNLEWRAQAQLLAAARGFGTNDLALAKERALQALESFVQLEDRPKEVETLFLLARIEADLGNFEQTKRYIDRASELMGNRDPRALINAGLAAAYAANHHQDFAATLDWATSTLQLARESGHREQVADALNLIGLAKTRIGEFDAARRALDEARDTFVAIGKRFGSAAIEVNMGLLELRLGKLELAYEHMSAALAELRALDHAAGQLIASTNLSSISIRLGRADEGLALAEFALQLARDTGSAPFEAVAQGSLGFALLMRGEPAAAIPHIEASLNAQQTIERRVDAVEMIATLALAQAASGDTVAARRSVDKLLQHSKEFSAAVWPQQLHWAAAQVYHAAGEDALARQQLDKAAATIAKLVATIARSGDPAPYASLPLNEAIARAKRDDVWPEIDHVPEGADSTHSA